MAHRFKSLRWNAGAALLGAALAASVGGSASTRDDLDRLASQVSLLQQRFGEMEARQADIQRALGEISSRLDAMARASQTADMRADLDILKRQVEALANQGAPRPDAPPPSALSPPEPARPHAQASPTPPPDGEALYSQAHRDYLGGRYELASSQFRQFIEAFPNDPKAPNAQYWSGECLYSQKRYDAAVEAFQAVLKLYPESSKSRAAQLKVGLCYLSLGDARRGRRALEVLVEEDPACEEAQLARERLDRMGAGQ